MGKAAAYWLRDAVPFLNKPSETDPAQAVEWSESGLQGSTPAAAAETQRKKAADALLLDQARARNDDQVRRHIAVIGLQREARAGAGSGQNLLREGLKSLQELAHHPMTWLVVTLCVIGGIAISMADRRPK